MPPGPAGILGGAGPEKAGVRFRSAARYAACPPPGVESPGGGRGDGGGLGRAARVWGARRRPSARTRLPPRAPSCGFGAALCPDPGPSRVDALRLTRVPRAEPWSRGRPHPANVAALWVPFLMGDPVRFSISTHPASLTGSHSAQGPGFLPCALSCFRGTFCNQRCFSLLSE